MDEEVINKKLRELICEITKMPAEQQQQLAPPISETKPRHQDIKKGVDKIEKSLMELRICIQYALFDLEATRRERDKLQTLLDNKSSQDDQPDRADGEM